MLVFKRFIHNASFLLQGKLIRVQIEALRILRCLLLLGIIDRELFK